MTREEYEERVRALEEQHRADIALLNAAHETRLRSLARLQEDAAARERDGAAPEASAATPPADIAAVAPPAPPPRAPNTVFYDLYEALDDLPEVFDRHDIIRLLGYAPARATLARALESLKDQGLIALETQSMGGSVNRYRKLQSED